MRVLLIAVPVAAALAQSPTSQYRQAEAAVRQGDFVHGIPVLKEILKQTPNNVRSLNLLGIAFVGAGRGDEANQRFRQALRADPKFLPALRNLAANELRMGLTDEARGDYQAALRLAPGDPALRVALAQIHFDAGLALARLNRYDEAASEFESARQGAADLFQVDFNLTLARLKGRRFADAAKGAEQMIAGGERSPEVYSLLAQAREGMGETNLAYEALRSATQIYPNDEAAYLELIALCAEHENFDLALEIAGIGLRVNRLSLRLPVQRGIVLAMMGRFEDAAHDLTAANSVQGRTARDLVLMRTGDVQSAVADLRGLSKTETDNYLVHWLLAEALTQSGSGSDDEAMDELQKSLALNPGLPQSRLLMGKLLFARGETGRAVEQLERALELDPGSVPAAYQLARALRKQGDTQRADALFARVGSGKTDSPNDVTRGGLLRIVRTSP